MELHSMWNDYPTLQTNLSQTLKLMEKSIHLKNKEVQQAIIQMIQSGGKLLRPAYQLLFSEFGKEKDRDKAIALAASIEMLHTASLIHDDIVDQANIRRNLPTIRATFGNDVAVYAGDYLFICCFKLMADYASDLKSLQVNSKSMEKILAGELGQMNQRYQVEMRIPEYLDNISGKTAELFALSCFIGAYESGCSIKLSNQAKEIGLNIGMAFQILDDVLDYSETDTQLGKPVLEDVRQGIYSLPLLYALQTKQNDLLPLLQKKELMTDADTRSVYQLVHTSGGVELAKKLAEKYTKQALKGINKLPNVGLPKDLLYEITEMILTRKN